MCLCVSVCVFQSDGLVGTQPEDQIPHEQRYENPAGISVTDTNTKKISVSFVGAHGLLSADILWTHM